jgi:small-conductance mechanosensitive channel
MEEILITIQKTVEPALSQVFIFLIQLALASLVFFIGWRITQVMQKIARRALYRRDPETAARLFAAVHRLILIGGIALSAAAALLVMGLQLETLMTSLGLASVGVAFALKDSLENSFSGLYLLFERTFKEGDVVAVTDIEGYVEAVSIRTTNIRTYDGLHVLVPNKMFFTNPFTNKTHYPSRRYELGVGVNYASDLRKAHTVILEAVTSAAGVLSNPLPSVTLDKFEPLFVHATVRYWINWQTTDLHATTTAISQAIVEAAHREGIDLFLQTQKVVETLKANSARPV